MTNALDAARRYVTEDRLSVIPIPHGQKAPTLPRWSTLRLTVDELPRHFNDSQNIGVLLGEPSGWWVDVDLDCPEAVRLAGLFLPQTLAVFGRAGKPRSHWVYVVTGAKTEQFKDPDGSMLVELRSTGAQTVFPPSVHPTGEAITWSGEEGAPASEDAAALRPAVAKLAVASLLARRWPAQGSRDEIAMALAGALLHIPDWSEDDVDEFVVAVADVAGDEEAASRGKAKATKAKMDQGANVTGWPRLRELLGADVADRAQAWLRVDEQRERPRTWTVGDLITLAQAAPAKQLVDGLLAEGDRFLITAFAGVGKSLFGLDLAFALHCGTEFLGHFATTQARVGYVDEESAPARLGQRLRQVVAGRGINSEQDLPLFRVISGERLDTPAGVEQLFAWVAEHQLGVLVIDTLRRVHRLKENEADDMARIESAMKTLQGKARTELGRSLTLVVLHHSPKAQSGGAETMARGSGDIIAAADGALYLRKKGTDAIEVEHAKARWSGQLEPFRVLIHATDTSLRLEFAGEDAPKQSRRSELHDLIVRILTDEGDPLSRGDIVKRAAHAGFKRRQTVQDELKAMVEDAQLIKEQAGRVTLYRLVPVDDDRF